MGYAQGKIAVITGAGSGIGRALAQQLNQQGSRLYLSDINAQTLAATVATLARKDVSADTQVLDVADKDAVYAWADRIAYAEGHVDIVINNAGVALLANVADSRIEDQEWLMGINFWGVVYGTQAFLPLLCKSPQANLVNISSIFGVIAVPTQSAYNAAKFAVRGYTEALRQEMADTPVRVCCVHPGGIKTNIARAARTDDTQYTADERDEEFQKLAGTSPESAAAQIIRAMEKGKKRLLIGYDAKLLSLLTRLFPVSYTRVIAYLGKRDGPVSI